MPAADSRTSRSLRALLKGVSRSFYLSIRLLPNALREPVALAYLLARASDTIADAPGLAAPERLAALDALAASIQRGGALPPLPDPSGMSQDEARLMQTLPECVEWLDRLGFEDKADVRTVLGHITRGQRLDIERPMLATAGELDEYTYLVAGCVGEFWTRLGLRHVPGFANLPESAMLALGRQYGQALQLINVLRDADADRAIGRRYLPPGDSPDPWLARAHEGLESGMRYAAALRHARIRVATALPALIGARTLSLVRTHGAGAKMPRRQVRWLLVRTLASLGSDAFLQREFRRWDNRAR